MAKLFKKETRYVLYRKSGRDQDAMQDAVISATEWREVDDWPTPYHETDTTWVKKEERLIEVNAANIVILPCPVGSTLYRIERQRKACSYHLNTRNNEYACINEIDCPHLFDGKCDEYMEHYIHKMNNADAQTILANAHLFGATVFTDEDAAQIALQKKQMEEDVRLKARQAADMSED